MKKKISWSNFESIHSDVTDTFEQLCRILFKRQFLDNTSVLTSSPNHPGIEVSPIYSPKVKRTISFQSKYFLGRVDYSQIQKSVNKTINGLIIRKDYLDQFLQENDLSVFWNFIGEKQYFIKSPRDQYYSRWNGFFWMVNSEIQSNIALDEQKLGSTDF